MFVNKFNGQKKKVPFASWMIFENLPSLLPRVNKNKK